MDVTPTPSDSNSSRNTSRTTSSMSKTAAGRVKTVASDGSDCPQWIKLLVDNWLVKYLLNYMQDRGSNGDITS